MEWGKKPTHTWLIMFNFHAYVLQKMERHGNLRAVVPFFKGVNNEKYYLTVISPF